MQIILDHTKVTKNFENRICNNFTIHYQLEEKEVFFENSKFYLFLKSNYSEKYINGILNAPEKVTQTIIYDSFKKDGFWVIVEKEDNQISIQRDLSGICTGYYHINEKEVSIGTNVHSLAIRKAKELDKIAVYQMLYFDFLWDGQTIYKGIEQLRQGGELVLSKKFNILKNTFTLPEILEEENQLSEAENIKRLRMEIVKAHKNYVNDKNVVFLSGGIDSVAMLIALNDLTGKENIVNHSFKVKGTEQDETVYAESIANHLENNLLIIERDFSNELNEKLFKQEILKMNNPYPGMWIFGNQLSNSKNTTYFAGQDTRLHTPSLNALDDIAFTIFKLSKKGFKPVFYVLDLLLWPLKLLFSFLLKVTNSKSKYFLGLRRALFIFNTKKYIELFYFKADKTILEALKLPIDHFDKIKAKYDFSLDEISNKRSLYNNIVLKKWPEQYVNDIRYMVDMANVKGAKLAMPFYDIDLAKFSASIPFDLSVKTMVGKAQFSDNSSRINKFVLREALIDKIDKKTYLRSKAVSRTGHLIFTQGLDLILKKIIKEDLESKSSLIREYELNNFVSKFLYNKKEWKMTDDKFLLKVYYLVSFIVYRNQLINM